MVKDEPMTLRTVLYDGSVVETDHDPALPATIGVQCRQAERHREQVRQHLIRTMSWRLLPSESWWEDAA